MSTKRTFKKARFIIFYYLTDQVDVKKIISILKKTKSPAYDIDSNANFTNLLKQEITNLAIFLFFQVFKNLFSSIQKMKSDKIKKFATMVHLLSDFFIQKRRENSNRIKL